jgi:tetratricopeptide (TPR) repeat protein
MYRRNGRVDEAIALYERSVAIAPHNHVAWQNLGLAYQKADRFEDSLRAYDRLIAITPENPEGWYGTGYVLLFSERAVEARPALRQAEALYRKRGESVDDVHVLLGIAAGTLGDWREVRVLLEPLYSRAGQLGVVNALLGQAYLQPDSLDRAKARIYLERAKQQGLEVSPALWQRATEPDAAPAKTPPTKR